MGKLEQGRLNLIETLKQDLGKVSSRFPDMESDISRIIELVDATSKESVDPFLLRDQVVSFVQPVETVELQNQADSVARSSLGVQVFIELLNLAELGRFSSLVQSSRYCCFIVGSSRVYSCRWIIIGMAATSLEIISRFVYCKARIIS